ncbi:MAG: hypothetical protein IKT42_05295, partial [Clostridia bacterium]|nr:hypothetical protein [Clostridia bacterium]
MKKIIKLSFVFLLIACSCVFVSLFIISDDISQNYRINRGDELKIDTPIPVTASYNGVKMSQGNFARHIGESFDV